MDPSCLSSRQGKTSRSNHLFTTAIFSRNFMLLGCQALEMLIPDEVELIEITSIGGCSDPVVPPSEKPCNRNCVLAGIQTCNPAINRESLRPDALTPWPRRHPLLSAVLKLLQFCSPHSAAICAIFSYFRSRSCMFTSIRPQCTAKQQAAAIPATNKIKNKQSVVHTFLGQTRPQLRGNPITAGFFLGRMVRALTKIHRSWDPHTNKPAIQCCLDLLLDIARPNQSTLFWVEWSGR